jgi:hypothetical protein
MSRRSLKSLAAAAGVAALVALSGPAGAAPATYAPPQVAWTGHNVNVSPDGSSAYINGKYRCYGGRTGTHLWVSVKQGPNLSEPDHTGSSYADAWYDTNWNFGVDPAGLTVACDGHWHTTRYQLKQEFGTLKDGPAYIQFCLFDNTANDDNFPQGFAFDYSWKSVHVPG